MHQSNEGEWYSQRKHLLGFNVWPRWQSLVVLYSLFSHILGAIIRFADMFAIKPIQFLGDSEHGDSKVNRWWREHMGLERLALHAYSIAWDGFFVSCPLFEDHCRHYMQTCTYTVREKNKKGAFCSL